MNIKPGLTFDDVLLVPKYSTVASRKDIDLSVDLGKGVKLKIPIISANMLNITGPKMARAIAELGGLALLHRFCPIEEQVSNFQIALQDKPEYINYIGCSIGVNEIDKEYLDKLIWAGCKIICIDVAHIHCLKGLAMTEYVAKKYPEILLIAGNIATGQAAIDLFNAGANVCKSGIGSGSLCSTRIEAGAGVPSLTALEEVFKVSQSSITNQRKFKIISDGGYRRAGDLCKGLCFSDVIMLGNLLAGTDEAPGNIITIEGKIYKEYAGSSTHKTNHIEGVAALVPVKGPVANVVKKLMEGLRSGCSYQGAHNLEELKINPEFVSISQAGLIESHPHSVILTEK